MCGYQRKSLSPQVPATARFQLDLPVLDARLSQIAHFSASTAYSKQKSSLQKELEFFLSSLPEQKDISSATPRDLCRFLACKDGKGKTQVHQTNCRFLGQHKHRLCDCPIRLAYGTVDSLIGKLRAIFNEADRRGEWDPRLLFGNPATDLSLKKYLRVITAEQLQARATPKQANPFFVHDLLRLCNYIGERMAFPNVSLLDKFVHMRDQAYFKTLMFSGDRPGDLGQVKTQEIVCFPNNDGFLFNHVGQNFTRWVVKPIWYPTQQHTRNLPRQGD